MSKVPLILYRLFFSKTAEITVVGLQVCSKFALLYKLATHALPKASGKTSFVNVLGSGQVCLAAAFSPPQTIYNKCSGVKMLYLPLHFTSASLGGET